jgi:hypothetical protein
MIDTTALRALVLDALQAEEKMLRQTDKRRIFFPNLDCFHLEEDQGDITLQRHQATGARNALLSVLCAIDDEPGPLRAYITKEGKP